MDITKLNSAINSVFGNISTSLDVGTILNLAKSLASYTITESSGFPTEVTYVTTLRVIQATGILCLRRILQPM